MKEYIAFLNVKSKEYQPKLASGSIELGIGHVFYVNPSDLLNPTVILHELVIPHIKSICQVEEIYTRFAFVVSTTNEKYNKIIVKRMNGYDISQKEINYVESVNKEEYNNKKELQDWGICGMDIGRSFYKVSIITDKEVVILLNSSEEANEFLEEVRTTIDNFYRNCPNIVKTLELK